ncbi:Na+/H+ antiporter subunit G [Corynebacterium heidelbergense]|uniref:Na+/H+ antiporter subunit G n=1 Tax=Corynebacterium heidelbergense TaxID=2055947 RepID=A0A364VB82_9CORY|nr:Na+/H+ antiporter subunit G [Corynebacterium heidelbergense]RAV33826.1 Na+/H+ antiporter subunit G [Corynebacterium heidelbergense]WCZ37497.1 putative monovalent cation/H+ antiporter subunit G [Corynebacterium heidelbergense]
MLTTVLAAEDMVHYSEMSWLGAGLCAVLVIAGSIFVFASARAMYLAPDAISQINMLGPGVGVGLPLLIAANLVHTWDTQGFELGILLKSVLAITGLLVVQAAGSSVMGRALHATHWDHTVPLSGGKKVKEPK